jgi:hypothetical protein
MTHFATPDELRDKAASIELKAVDFLDRHGHIAKVRSQWVTVRMTFIDGATLTLPRAREHEFEQTVFNLRPARNDS